MLGAAMLLQLGTHEQQLSCAATSLHQVPAALVARFFTPKRGSDAIDLRKLLGARESGAAAQAGMSRL
jgi:hypothetical protein